MILQYAAATANCGNDGIGREASAVIAQNVTKNQLDFMVINCQEADSTKVFDQLQKQLQEPYKIMRTDIMSTHTKAKAQLTDRFGITSFVVYNSDTVQEPVMPTPSTKVRRSSKRSEGSAYNKGGLVSNVLIKHKQSGEEIMLQAMSSHLDSKSAVQRNNDRLKINQSRSSDASDWSALVQSYPDIVAEGVDRNTRDQYNSLSETNPRVQVWQNPSAHPDIHALYQVSPGADNYSSENTYFPGKNTTPSAERESKKRPGEIEFGSLDCVNIDQGDLTGAGVGSVTTVAAETGSKRDHALLISPIHTYEKKSDFEKVKGQMANRLARVAPELSANVRQLTESDLNIQILRQIHEKFLSPGGLINQAMEQHIQRLALYEQLINKYDATPGLAKKLELLLFNDKPWFASSNEGNYQDASLATFLPNKIEQSFLTVKEQYISGAEMELKNTLMDLKAKIASFQLKEPQDKKESALIENCNQVYQSLIDTYASLQSIDGNRDLKSIEQLTQTAKLAIEGVVTVINNAPLVEQFTNKINKMPETSIGWLAAIFNKIKEAFNTYVFGANYASVRKKDVIPIVSDRYGVPPAVPVDTSLFKRNYKEMMGTDEDQEVRKRKAPRRDEVDDKDQDDVTPAPK